MLNSMPCYFRYFFSSDFKDTEISQIYNCQNASIKTVR